MYSMRMKNKLTIGLLSVASIAVFIGFTYVEASNGYSKPKVTFKATNITQGMNSKENSYAYDVNWQTDKVVGATISVSCSGSGKGEYISIKQGNANEQSVACSKKTVVYNVLEASAGTITIAKTSGNSVKADVRLSIFDHSKSNKKPIVTKKLKIKLIPPQGTSNVPQSLNGKCGLMVDNPSKNQIVSFPLDVKGRIDNTTSGTSDLLGNCTWSMFEGVGGMAQLYYNYQNTGWKPIGVSVPMTVADWTATKTTFSARLNFYNGGIGLPNGTPLKIIFTEENAAARNPADIYELPVKLGQ